MIVEKEVAEESTEDNVRAANAAAKAVLCKCGQSEKPVFYKQPTFLRLEIRKPIWNIWSTQEIPTHEPIGLGAYFVCIMFILLSLLKKNFFKCLFIFERERQSMSRGGAEREGDTKSEAGSKLSAQSPAWGLNLTNRETVT